MCFNMVPEAGLEPARLSSGDFKSPVSTISPPGQILHKFLMSNDSFTILPNVLPVGSQATSLTCVTHSSTYRAII